MKNLMIEKVESINKAVQKKADKIKGVSAAAAKKGNHAINDAKVKNDQKQEKKDTIKKDLTTGFKKIKKDIHKTNKRIAKELKSI